MGWSCVDEIVIIWFWLSYYVACVCVYVIMFTSFLNFNQDNNGIVLFSTWLLSYHSVCACVIMFFNFEILIRIVMEWSYLVPVCQIMCVFMSLCLHLVPGCCHMLFVSLCLHFLQFSNGIVMEWSYLVSICHRMLFVFMSCLHFLQF